MFLTLVLLLTMSMPAVADRSAELERQLGKRDAIGDYIYGGQIPSQVELSRYRSQSPSPCKGAHAAQAVEVAITSHWRWAVLYYTRELGDPQTRRAFDDSQQALRYLVDDLSCDDPLIRYRYANNKHMQRDYEASVLALSRVVDDIGKHYPRMKLMALRQYADALGITGDLDGAIATQRQLLAVVPGGVLVQLNLANRLAQRGNPDDVKEARALIAQARASGVSEHSESVIVGIEAMLL